jgi:translation elongation factor EF-Tu-like GTPase
MRTFDDMSVSDLLALKEYAIKKTDVYAEAAQETKEGGDEQMSEIYSDLANDFDTLHTEIEQYIEEEFIKPIAAFRELREKNKD